MPPALVTGHHEVDAQHAAILAEAARLRGVDAAGVREALRFLEHYTASHFEYEERLMEDVAYPGLEAHRANHLAFAEELAALREALGRDGPTPARVAALAAAVEGWVADHVLAADRRLAEFVRGLGAVGTPGRERARGPAARRDPP